MNKNINNNLDDDLDDDLNIGTPEKEVDLSRYQRNTFSNEQNQNNVGVESVADYDGRSPVGNRKKFGQGLSAMMVLLILVAVGAVAYGVWYATTIKLGTQGEDKVEVEETPSQYDGAKSGSRDFAQEFQGKQLEDAKLAEEQALLDAQANNPMNAEIVPVGNDSGMAMAPMPEQQMNYAPAPTAPMEKPKSAQELRLERMLASNFNGNVGQSAMGMGGSIRGTNDDSGQGQNQRSNGALSRLNSVSAFAGTQAGKAGNRELTLDKGAFIDCVMTTKFHSQLAGMLTCEVTRNIYSASGRVILIDRGSRVTGQYEGDVKTGQSRVFVIWDRIVTPKGVTINIDSPASSQLGESGLTGRVNNHFFKRFGGALMVSLVTGVSEGVGKSVGASIGRQIDKGLGNDGNPTTVVDLGGGSNSAGDVAGKIIEQTSNIPPSIIKHQGDKVTIYVARDVDFSTVYALK